MSRMKVELANNQKKKCSPKGYAVINSLDFTFVVELAPQQRWYFEIKDNERYKVERQNLTLTITKEQFDNIFKMME